VITGDHPLIKTVCLRYNKGLGDTMVYQQIPFIFGRRALSVKAGVLLIYAALLGVIGTGYLSSFSQAAVLDHFEIKTMDDHHVQVVLHTDGRTTYETQNGSSGFKLVLKNTALSAKNIQQGLPVVIDNESRYIGRAVPDDNGQVRIIIPNLNPDNISVSVIHQTDNPSTSAQSNTPVVKQPVKAPVKSAIKVNGTGLPTKEATKTPSTPPKPTATEKTPTIAKAVNKTASSEPLQLLGIEDRRATSLFDELAQQLSHLTTPNPPSSSPMANTATPSGTRSVKPQWVRKPTVNSSKPSTYRTSKTPTIVSVSPMAAGPYKPVDSKFVNTKPIKGLPQVTPLDPPTTAPSNSTAQYRFPEWDPEHSVIAVEPTTLPLQPTLTQEIFDPPTAALAMGEGGGPVFAGTLMTSPYGNSTTTTSATTPPEPTETIPEPDTLHATPSMWEQFTTAIPIWLWVVAGILLAGVGLFLLVGVLLMAKLLIAPLQPPFQPALYNPYGFTGRTAPQARQPSTGSPSKPESHPAQSPKPTREFQQTLRQQQATTQKHSQPNDDSVRSSSPDGYATPPRRNYPTPATQTQRSATAVASPPKPTIESAVANAVLLKFPSIAQRKAT